LRYLGYRGQEITPELNERMVAMSDRCEAVARPASVVQAYSAKSLPLSLPGSDIAKHLRDAREVVLFAVTIGHDVDKELRRLGVVDPVGQVLFDAAATAAIEREADRVEARIRADAAERGMFCSWRFSPGYGDLPLEVQPVFLQSLDASRRLGITLTSGNLMVPTKSVTAFVGIYDGPQAGVAASCDMCSLADACALRARGITCA
jgi:hypothetical protein